MHRGTDPRAEGRGRSGRKKEDERAEASVSRTDETGRMRQSVCSDIHFSIASAAGSAGQGQEGQGVRGERGKGSEKEGTEERLRQWLQQPSRLLNEIEC